MSKEPVNTKEYEAECPECHEQCGWCSDYKWMVREIGCGTMPWKGKKHHCDKSKEERGKVCGTCGGSKKVLIRQEIYTYPDGVVPLNPAEISNGEG